MAVYEIKNDSIAIKVESHGAELKSLIKLSSNEEYMWSGDPEYWGRISPLLFPFVGGVKNRQYRAKGQTYPMTQHGFVRDMEFKAVSVSDNEIWFEVCSDDETREAYPYDFCLRAGYRLDGNKAEVLWKVINPGEETLYFSIGGHPAFKCPFHDNEKQTDCYIGFEGTDKVISSQISENGLATDDKEIYELQNEKLPVTENLFDKDALVIEHDQVKTVTLCGSDGIPYVKVEFDVPLFGIWSPAGKHAPFICIEPWYGRCDHENFTGSLEDREWGNSVLPGKAWNASYIIEV